MSGEFDYREFDYEAAWHTLVGWVNSMADEDRRPPMPAHVRQDLAAGYVFAVKQGMPAPEALEVEYPIRVAREALGMA